MKPKAFTQALKTGKPGPGYLFLGTELFFRDRCRRALRKAMFGDDEQAAAEGVVEIDLKDQPLSRLLDETRSFSLFASSRLIYGVNAEAALPKGRSSAGDEAQDELARYFKNPTPATVVVFESTKFDVRDRDDKAKLERVAKFFSAVPEVVELDRLTADDAFRGAVALAQQIDLSIGRDVLVELVDMLGADMARIENELTKLSLYAEPGQTITREDIETLAPEARQRGVFELTDALAERDRARALEILDTLAKSGAYWPMQITFLASLFRQALAVKELGGTNPRQVMGAMGKFGFRMWPARAQQLIDVARKFSRQQLETALIALYEADRDLRRERPEDRLIMEQLVIRLT